MTVRLLLPARSLTFEGVTRVELETEAGRLTMLPRHRDAGAALEAGILRMQYEDADSDVVGVDGGSVVKTGSTVAVVTPRAVVGEQLGEVSENLRERMARGERRHKQAEQALARMELELARNLLSDEDHT